MPDSALLEVRDLTKHFGGTRALRGVSCHLRAGEVLALLGHNGAGKSTLIKILAGVYRADSGEMRLGGEPLGAGVAAARAAGLAVIYQDLSLFPNLSVAENIAGDLAERYDRTESAGRSRWSLRTCFASRRGMPALLSASPSRRQGTGYAPRRVREQAAVAVARLGLPGGAWLDLRLGDLPIAVQQQVAIARALAREARVLILDEPTASLSVEEVDRLLTLVRQLAAGGCGIIFVSHRMAEVRRIADRFLVLRDGEVALDREAGGCEDGELARALFGEQAGAEAAAAHAATPGEVVLEARNCTRAGEFEDVTLTLRAGEVTVLAGLVGSGRSEFAQALFGLRRLEGGEVVLSGRPLVARHPRQAIEAGLAYVPEDRLKEGLFPSFTVATNLAGAMLHRLSRWGLVPRRAGRAAEAIDEYGIRCAGPEAPLSSLSGGNQQKVLLAKWQATNPAVLILDEPTAGVDIGAKAEIHARARRWAAGGKAVLAISSDLDEVFELADRVLVFHQGRLVLDRARAGLTRDALIGAMLGAQAASVA